MPRKRIIDPEYWLDGEISRISDKARLLYIGLWNFADDNGIIENDPQKIKVQVFPYSPQLKIENYLKELEDIKKIISYKKEGKEYYWIKNFYKYQKGIKFPSKRYPTPDIQDISDNSTPDIPIVEKSNSRVIVEKSNSNSNNTKVLQKPVEYGNKDINQLINLLKERFQLKILDGSEGENRKYCWLAIKKFKREGVEGIIEIGSKNNFWQNKITNFKSLYYNGVKIFSTIKGREIKKIKL